MHKAKTFCISIMLCTHLALHTCQPPTKTSHTIQDLRDNILDAYNKPSPALKAVLSLFTIEHDDTLKTIVAQTQKKFLRPADTERWNLADRWYSYKNQALPLFEDLGLARTVAPSHTLYDYVLLMGGSVDMMRMRLKFLAHAYEQGVRAKQLIALGCQRKLCPQQECKNILLHPDEETYPTEKTWQAPETLPTTETEMICMMFQQIKLPACLRAAPLECVDTPMQRGSDGHPRRANTADTVRHWLATKSNDSNETPKKLLVISNQPYVGYQDAVVNALVPKHFFVETVGPASNDTNVALYLDTITRWLYMKNIIREEVRARL